MWADSATGLQGIETWLNAHPALLSLVQNTGTVVGGVMWLKNLTPVGLVSYLMVNYGYNQVLSLLDGNTEVAKQHLTTYFSEHDAEITPEQASYLGNVAMQVLHTAGQIVVHQVAATKFNAVRRGSGVKQSIGKKGGAGRRGGGVAKHPLVENWRSSDLPATIQNFSPGSKAISNAKGTKLIYTNQNTGIQIIYDKQHGYFRLKDIEGCYLDLNSSRVHAPSQMTGRNASDYVQKHTHFTVSD